MTAILTFLKANRLAAIIGAVALVLAILAGTYFKGRSDGTEATEARYAAMALKAAEKAREASEHATADKDERDSDFALEQKEISDAVIQAERDGRDPTIEYFNQLRGIQSNGDKATAK